MINKTSGCLIGVLLLVISIPVKAKQQERQLLRRIFAYPSTVLADAPDSIETNSYLKFRLQIDKKNVALLTMPTMFHIARGNEREFLSESYSHLVYYNKEKTLERQRAATSYEQILDARQTQTKKSRQLFLSTIRKRKSALDNISQYLKPDIYNVTIINDYLLSPFYKFNRRFYIYHNLPVSEKTTRIFFTPKLNNTQLVKGSALVDSKTGRIINCDFEGEYDMTRFQIHIQLGNEGVKSLMAKECTVNAKISYLGNRINTWVSAFNDLRTQLPDSLHDAENGQLMNELRPTPLDTDEQRILKNYLESKRMQNDTESVQQPKKRSMAKHLLWDVVGDNLLNRIRTNFGDNDRGSLRIDPLFNPLYFGYSKQKGLVYKLKMRAHYNFTSNSDLSLMVKGGYLFKQHQLYFNIPLQYTFNKERNGYLRLDFGNGNRITNSSVLDHVKQEHSRDSVDFSAWNLDYFKDMSVRAVANYEFSRHFGIQGGGVFHRRSAVDAGNFRKLGQPISYKTFAPLLQLQYRPAGFGGIILTADYEHAVKGVLGSDISYSRWEFDASYVHPLPCTRSLSLRGGIGFYSSRDDEQYFLDYTNFRDNNIPGGWNDDWSGEFELLDHNWYNASDYYVRLNTTYESPVMLLAWLPKVGQVVEKERIYISTLTVRNLNPYIECGYGFTNRLFSMGMFTGFSPHHFEGFGFKFGLELFDNW